MHLWWNIYFLNNFVNSRGYKKRRRVPDGYGYGYGTNIYPVDKVKESYYQYPICPVGIPSHNIELIMYYFLNFIIGIFLLTSKPIIYLYLSRSYSWVSSSATSVEDKTFMSNNNWRKCIVPAGNKQDELGTSVTLPCSPLSPQLASFLLVHVGLDPEGVTCRRDSEAQVSQNYQKGQICD